MYLNYVFACYKERPNLAKQIYVNWCSVRKACTRRSHLKKNVYISISHMLRATDLEHFM